MSRLIGKLKKNLWTQIYPNKFNNLWNKEKTVNTKILYLQVYISQN